MTSSADCEFPAAQKKILMRRLDFISEEHRNYLLKTYDLAGISLRINRYLTMTRKEKTMAQHGEQCAVVYNQLQRGFDKDLQSILASKNDPNVPHYDTAVRPHGNNETKQTALTKTTAVEPIAKRIPLETYQKRKQEAMNYATKTVDVAKKLEPLPKLVQDSQQKNDKQSVEKTKETKVTRLHHKGGKSKAQIQLLNDVNKASSLQEVCKNIDQNNKNRQSVDKARVIIVTSPHHQRKGSKNKKRKFNDAREDKKIDKKIDKTKRSVDKAKATKTSQKHDATKNVTQPLKKKNFGRIQEACETGIIDEIIATWYEETKEITDVFEVRTEHDEIIDEITAPWFQEKNDDCSYQKLCKDDIENNQKQPSEPAKAIDEIKAYLKSSETNIEKPWSSNANEIDFLPWIHQTCKENSNDVDRSLSKATVNAVSKIDFEIERLTNASNLRLGAKPLLNEDQINKDIHKANIAKALTSHHDHNGGAVITKNHDLASFQAGTRRLNNAFTTSPTSKRRHNDMATISNQSRMPTGLQALQMFCKQTVPNSKKRALESTDMNEPLPKYIQKFGPYCIPNLIDSANKRYTSSKTSNVFKDELDNTVNMINTVPSPLRYNKKRSLDSSNEINTFSDVKKMKIDFTITSPRYLYQ